MLLKDEQNRLRKIRATTQQQIAQLTLELDATQKGLDAAISLLRQCDKAYRASGDQARRALCFAFFDRISVDIDDIQSASPKEPFVQILDPSLPVQVRAFRHEVTADQDLEKARRSPPMSTSCLPSATMSID